MPIGIINLNTEGRLSPTLFHSTNPERYELSTTNTYTANCMNCIGKARVVNRPASLVDLFFFFYFFLYDASSPDFVSNVTKQESIFDDSIEQVFTTNGFRIFS
ncbi:hypothetical protein ALC56_12376 [Trachymyrmex septentrionalis]|uniref:Uncharacterized protein n=1 Tax=Trachymyrmex septentrionalis TaxID=34720 RepID=A0A195EZ92_9HYME|nr:hypothetical protein ALC56_12376 [Trachymyrmex septentrionalis]